MINFFNFTSKEWRSKLVMIAQFGMNNCQIFNFINKEQKISSTASNRVGGQIGQQQSLN